MTCRIVQTASWEGNSDESKFLMQTKIVRLFSVFSGLDQNFLGNKEWECDLKP